jgi:exonuclease I
MSTNKKEEMAMADLNFKKSGIFAAGVLFGTAGIKLLSSKDAKKVYTSCTAAVLRAKDCVMKTVTTIQENAEDIYEEAKQINEDRAAEEDIYEEFEDEDPIEDEAEDPQDEEAKPE